MEDAELLERLTGEVCRVFGVSQPFTLSNGGGIMRLSSDYCTITLTQSEEWGGSYRIDQEAPPVSFNHSFASSNLKEALAWMFAKYARLATLGVLE